MPRLSLLHVAFCFLLVTPLTIGCGGSSEPESVAEGDEIEQFLAENPEMAVDIEEEESVMEADAVIDGE